MARRAATSGSALATSGSHVQGPTKPIRKVVVRMVLGNKIIRQKNKTADIGNFHRGWFERKSKEFGRGMVTLDRLQRWMDIIARASG